MRINQHEWVAIFQIHLTDKEAAKAYTFSSHGKQVIASKMRAGDGFVDVGCFACEEPYQLVHDRPCIGNTESPMTNEMKRRGVA